MDICYCIIFISKTAKPLWYFQFITFIPNDYTALDKTELRDASIKSHFIFKIAFSIILPIISINHTELRLRKFISIKGVQNFQKKKTVTKNEYYV